MTEPPVSRGRALADRRCSARFRFGTCGTNARWETQSKAALTHARTHAHTHMYIYIDMYLCRCTLAMHSILTTLYAYIVYVCSTPPPHFALPQQKDRDAQIVLCSSSEQRCAGLQSFVPANNYMKLVSFGVGQSSSIPQLQETHSKRKVLAYQKPFEISEIGHHKLNLWYACI